MAYRITVSDLQLRIDAINLTLGYPVKPYRQVNGKHQANIGNYHLDSAYGGYALAQFRSEMGSEIDVFLNGHMTKRVLFELLCAFLRGIAAAHYQQSIGRKN